MKRQKWWQLCRRHVANQGIRRDCHVCQGLPYNFPNKFSREHRHPLSAVEIGRVPGKQRRPSF
eukprot:2786797-Pyramimonas_sp.AAC.1